MTKINKSAEKGDVTHMKTYESAKKEVMKMTERNGKFIPQTRNAWQS